MLSFTERMEVGKQVAQDRRNRGLPSGQPAKGWGKVNRFYNCQIKSMVHFDTCKKIFEC